MRKLLKILPDFIRQLFARKTPAAPSIPAQTVDEEDWLQARYFLMKDGKAVGVPYSSRRPEIRVVYVADFVEAFQFFLRLCNQSRLSTSRKAGYWMCIASSSGGARLFSFSNRSIGLDQEVIAILRVETEEFIFPLKEIRFRKKNSL